MRLDYRIRYRACPDHGHRDLRRVTDLFAPTEPLQPRPDVLGGFMCLNQGVSNGRAVCAKVLFGHSRYEVVMEVSHDPLATTLHYLPSW